MCLGDRFYLMGIIDTNLTNFGHAWGGCIRRINFSYSPLPIMSNIKTTYHQLALQRSYTDFPGEQLLFFPRGWVIFLLFIYFSIKTNSMHLMFFVVWWIITSSSSHVVEQVMIFHECLQGNYDMVSKLQITCSTMQPASDQCQKVIYDDFFLHEIMHSKRIEISCQFFLD